MAEVLAAVFVPVDTFMFFLEFTVLARFFEVDFFNEADFVEAVFNAAGFNVAAFDAVDKLVDFAFFAALFAELVLENVFWAFACLRSRVSFVEYDLTCEDVAGFLFSSEAGARLTTPLCLEAVLILAWLFLRLDFSAAMVPSGFTSCCRFLSEKIQRIGVSGAKRRYQYVIHASAFVVNNRDVNSKRCRYNFTVVVLCNLMVLSAKRTAIASVSTMRIRQGFSLRGFTLIPSENRFDNDSF